MADDYYYENTDYSGNDGIVENTPDIVPADYSGNDAISSEMADAVMEGLDATGVDLNKWSWEGATGDFARADRTMGINVDEQPTTGDFARADRAMDYGKSEGESSLASKFGSFLSGTGDFLSKYKVPLEMVGRGIQTAMQNKQTERLAQKQSDARIRELKEADQLKQAANARYSASVSGLRPTGLINQTPLRRIGGRAVFGPGGQLNKE